MGVHEFAKISNIHLKIICHFLVLESDRNIIFFCTESSILPRYEDTYSTFHSVRQHTFVKNEFRYLNVSAVGTFTVYDALDCAFECLSNPSCLSVNMAAYKGTNGVLWCELLSSDKYRNASEYEGNESSHHFSIKV